MRLTFFSVFLLVISSTFAIAAETHHPQSFLEEIRGSEHEGEKIVTHFCASCHAERPLIRVGAPRVQHEADWCIRLKRDSKVLWKHTIEGFNAMPARGGCFECSDEQLLLAIEAMLPKTLKEKTLLELKAHK